jgi:alpha-L-fucosidase 2
VFEKEMRVKSNLRSITFMKLWYDTDAEKWTDALPMGNGQMGAMAYGGEKGRFDLTEVTCWSGSKQENVLKKDAADYMSRARKEFIAGNIEAGEELMSHCDGIKGNYGTQLPLGRLFVGVEEGKTESANRKLDLRTGVCEDELSYDGFKIRRQSFISCEDKVMVVRLWTDGKTMKKATVRLEGLNKQKFAGVEDHCLVVKGRAYESIHSDGRHGVAYQCRLAIKTDGGVASNENVVTITNAREITVIISAVTDMFFADADVVSKKRVGNAVEKGWNALEAAHISEHTHWMDRCSFSLPEGVAAQLPTDKRLESYRKGNADNGLAALLFQYGRYLLLNSSRPDSQLPAALQGIWNDDRACRMGWTDDMHLDINTQLNYFPAEAVGLGECCTPLFDWIANALAVEGKKVAKELYGCSGWVAHTISNAFGWAAPGWDGVNWQFNVSGGAWVATHLWFHYLYTGDIQFLRKYYPVLRGAAEFLYHLLLPDPKTGELLITPSYSPENSFLFHGEHHAISAGATCDMIMTKYLFAVVIKASEILDLHDSLVDEIKTAVDKLPPFRIGKNGQLMEWNQDFDEVNPDHRHVTHVLSVYPFGMIDPDDTPELAKAVKVSLERRLAAGAQDIVDANWSATLLMLYYARLQDGEQSAKFIHHLLTDLSQKNMLLTHRDGIYELDGNTGFTAGVAEMLLHSHRNELHVLPAIPLNWVDGSFEGLVGEGGHKVSVCWKNSVPVNLSVTAGRSGNIKLRFKDTSICCKYVKNQTRRFIYINGYLVPQ